MHLVVAEAVDDVAPGLLEALRPFDVVALVEPGAQLEQRRDLLAGFGGGNQRFGQVRLTCQAVQRDLDGNDGGVGGGFAQHLHERIHALIGVGEQDFPFGHLLHDGAVLVERGGPLRGEGRVQQGRALLFGQACGNVVGVAHVEGHRSHEGLVLLEVEALHQKRPHGAGKRTLAFQADGGKARAFLQDALHVFAVILVRLVGALGCVEVGVAGDADDVGVLDGVHGKHLGHHHLDGVFQQDELQPVAGQDDDALALARHGDKPQRHPLGTEVLRGFRLFNGRFLGFVGLALLLLRLGGAFRVLGVLGLFVGLALVLAFGVLPAVRAGFLVQTHHHVQRPVFQVGEGVARVDDLRGQEGQHVSVQVVAQEGLLFGAQVGRAHLADAGLLQKRTQFFVGALVVGVELVAARIDGGKLLGGGHARLCIDDMLLDQRKVGQAAHAHHEELPQVAPENGDEVQAFEQGHGFVGSLVEDALVEGEPGKLAVLHVGRCLRSLLIVHGVFAFC